MGKSQRTKGAVFERELAAEFSSAFAPFEFKRNIGQARDGGHDLDVGCLVVEAKRRASLKGLREWVLQASLAAASRQRTAAQQGKPAARRHHIPTVVMREDGGAEPMVLLGFSDFLMLAGDVIAGSL